MMTRPPYGAGAFAPPPPFRAACLAILFLCAVTAKPCALVQQDPITARDVAEIQPEFTALPPELPVAPAPIPGARRVVRAVELSALARNHGLDIVSSENVCFEWAMETLDPERVVKAMRDALADPAARIEILETSRYPVPRGRLEFRRTELASVRTPAIWHGAIVYGGSRRFPVWARVQLTTRPPDINRGERITVQVRDGVIHFTFPARSESAGRNGEMVTVRNLSSNRTFLARVEGRGNVLLDLSSQGN